MFCWPDIWLHVKRLLPMLATLAVVLGYALLVALLLWAPKIQKRWLLITSRVLGAVGLALFLVALVPMFLGSMFVAGNPPRQSRIVLSKEGQQATVNYDAGFLGRDYTEVTLKKAGCCRHIPVFSHSGPSELNDMTVQWIDENHLHLTYHMRPGDLNHCEPIAEQINIVCTPLPWPDTRTR